MISRFRLSAALAIAAVGFFPAAHAAIPAAEHAALVNLYNQTNGANWTTKTNWNIAVDECTWYGITCDAAHTHVTDIMVRFRLSQG